MASILSNEILQAIKNDGYWKSDNADTGQRVDDVLRPRIDLQTTKALELLKASTFDNEVGKTIYPRLGRS